MTKQEFLKYLKIVLTLCLITAIIGAMLALVNAVTKDRIAENTQKATNEAIASIFGDCEASVLSIDHSNETVSEIYLVKVQGSYAGFCVLVTPKGYGGQMELMVGLTLEGAVKRVSVVSHDETSGIGTKVLEDESYLANYDGKMTSASCDDVDAISGATRSSRALADGVKAALSLNLGSVPLMAEEVAE